MNSFTPDHRPERPDISLTEATVSGYGFVKDNYHTLLKWAVIPIVLNFFTYLVIDWQVPEGSTLTPFLVSVPATAAFAWYVFVQTRLQVFDEALGDLSADESYRLRRRDDAVLSISCYILFQMAATLIMFALSGSMEMEVGDTLSPDQMVRVGLGLFLFFYILKYGVVHLVAAVDGDILDYLKRVKGMWFSFVLVGAGFVSTLPVLLLFMFLLSFIAPGASSAEGLENNARLSIYAFGTIMSWAVTMILNACLVDVLRQLYQKKTGRS